MEKRRHKNRERGEKEIKEPGGIKTYSRERML